MKKGVIYIVFLFCCVYAFGQDIQHFEISKYGIYNPTEDNQSFSPRIQSLEMPSPNGTSLRSILLRKKNEMAIKYPRANSSIKKDNSRSSKDTLYESHSFEGNPYDNGTPEDNNIAISNSGYLMSVINSNIRAYDINNNDSIVLSKTLHQFSLGLAFNSKFDPKVVYDPIADKFVLVYLNGFTHQTSKIVVAFSTTDNPSDPWNIYTLPGNPIDNSTWADYPVIGISTSDLYIGVNTFTNGSSNNSGFVEACFWQVGLSGGYDGASTLTTNYFSDVMNGSDTLFNITPIQGGTKPYGPHMYLLSNKALENSNNQYTLIKVNNSSQDGNVSISTNIYNSSDNYYLPPDGVQPNGHAFDLNDSRILGGFLENGKIQFVQSCLDPTNGNGAIYHGFINNVNSNPTISGSIISDGYSDFGYPNIAYAGLSTIDNSSIINYNMTSSTFNPGMGSVYYSSEGAYSAFKILKEGTGHVDIFPDNRERWGDYSDIQRKYDEPCSFWAVGTFGTSTNENGTWISKLHTKDTCIIPEVEDSVEYISDGLLYPNPVSDIVNINFKMENTNVVNIQLFDSRGNLIDKLFEERAKEGENVFYFDASSLSQGIYFVRFSSNEKLLFKHKFVKN